ADELLGLVVAVDDAVRDAVAPLDALQGRGELSRRPADLRDGLIGPFSVDDLVREAGTVVYPGHRGRNAAEDAVELRRRPIEVRDGVRQPLGFRRIVQEATDVAVPL